MSLLAGEARLALLEGMPERAVKLLEGQSFAVARLERGRAFALLGEQELAFRELRTARAMFLQRAKALEGEAKEIMNRLLYLQRAAEAEAELKKLGAR